MGSNMTLYEDEYLDIEEEARLRFRSYERRKATCDINIRDGLDFWVALVTKEREQARIDAILDEWEVAYDHLKRKLKALDS